MILSIIKILHYFKSKIICFLKFGTFSTHKTSKKILEKKILEFRKETGGLIITNRDFCNAIGDLRQAFCTMGKLMVDYEILDQEEIELDGKKAMIIKDMKFDAVSIVPIGKNE